MNGNSISDSMFSVPYMMTKKVGGCSTSSWMGFNRHVVCDFTSRGSASFLYYTFQSHSSVGSDKFKKKRYRKELISLRSPYADENTSCSFSCCFCTFPYFIFKHLAHFSWKAFKPDRKELSSSRRVMVTPLNLTSMW